MGALFARLRGGGGGSSNPPAGPSRVSDQDRAILVRLRVKGETIDPSTSSQQLKRQRDELNKYQKRVNNDNPFLLTCFLSLPLR